MVIIAAVVESVSALSIASRWPPKSPVPRSMVGQTMHIGPTGLEEFMHSGNVSKAVEEFRQFKRGHNSESSGLAGILNMTIYVQHASPLEAELAYKAEASQGLQAEEKAWVQGVQHALARDIASTLNVSNATAASLARSMLAEVLASRSTTTLARTTTSVTSTSQSTISLHFAYSGQTLAPRPVLPTVAGTTATASSTSTTVALKSRTWTTSSTTTSTIATVYGATTSSAPLLAQQTTRSVQVHNDKPIIDALERYFRR